MLNYKHEIKLGIFGVDLEGFNIHGFLILNQVQESMDIFIVDSIWGFLEVPKNSVV